LLFWSRNRINRYVIFYPSSKFDQDKIIRCWVMAKNTILKIVDVRRLEFGKFWSLVKWLSSLSEFASDVHQISSNPDNFWLSYGALTISKWWTAAILDFWNLQFMSHDLCSACHSASTCKNLLRSDDRLLSSVQKRPTSWILKVLIFGQCITRGVQKVLQLGMIM